MSRNRDNLSVCLCLPVTLTLSLPPTFPLFPTHIQWASFIFHLTNAFSKCCSVGLNPEPFGCEANLYTHPQNEIYLNESSEQTDWLTDGEGSVFVYQILQSTLAQDMAVVVVAVAVAAQQQQTCTFWPFIAVFLLVFFGLFFLLGSRELLWLLQWAALGTVKKLFVWLEILMLCYIVVVVSWAELNECSFWLLWSIWLRMLVMAISAPKPCAFLIDFFFQTCSMIRN